MNIETLFYFVALLIPVAAGSGWYVATQQQKKEKRQALLTSSRYFRGINFLLNQDQQKATDAFFDLLTKAELSNRLDFTRKRSFEMYLALGAILRTRGEYERAVSLHKKLIDQSEKQHDQRATVTMELGQDYLRAGLFDYAEKEFAQYVDHPDHGIFAAEKLIDIFILQHRWEEALILGDRLKASHDDVKWSAITAHFCCEIAQECFERKAAEQEIDKWVQEALRRDQKSIRALLIKAQLALDYHHYDSALSLYRQIFNLDPHQISQLVDNYAYVLEQVCDASSCINEFEEILAMYPNDDVLCAVVDMIEKHQSKAKASALINVELNTRFKYYGLKSVEKWIKLDLLEAFREDQDVKKIKRLTHRLTLLEGESIHFLCSHCGFMSKSMHWQCPSCKSWNTLLRAKIDIRSSQEISS